MMKKPSLKILVADDHPFIRRVIVEALKDLKEVEFSEVADGAEALVCLGVIMEDSFPANGSLPSDDTFFIGRSDVDCLVTDFNMPGINGLHLLRMIRANLTAVRYDLPVIMVTGFDDSSLIAAALELDVNAFVTKPVAKASLIERIHDGLQSSAVTKTPAEYAAVTVPDLAEHSPREEQAPSGLAQSAEAKEGIDVSMLRAGAVLSADLRGADGRLLLSKGSVLSESTIKRLQELEAVTGIRNVAVT